MINEGMIISGGVSLNPYAGPVSLSYVGTASTPALSVTGQPYAGTGTTSFPLLYLNDSNATASTTLNTAGTYLGVNASGVTLTPLNLMVNGASYLVAQPAAALAAKLSVGANYVGSSTTASGAGTIQLGGTSLAGTATNSPGGSATLQPGLGTGNATASTLTINSVVPTSSGTGQQSYATAAFTGYNSTLGAYLVGTFLTNIAGHGLIATSGGTGLCAANSLALSAAGGGNGTMVTVATGYSLAFSSNTGPTGADAIITRAGPSSIAFGGGTTASPNAISLVPSSGLAYNMLSIPSQTVTYITTTGQTITSQYLVNLAQTTFTTALAAATVSLADTFRAVGPTVGGNVTGTLGIAGDFVAGSGFGTNYAARFTGATLFNGNVGFFNTSPTTQQTVGANVNNVIASGTTGQFDDFTSLTVYATDAQAIHNDIYQLGRSVAQLTTAVRAYGLGD